MTKQYKILDYKYFDERGKCTNQYYYIKYKKPFLFFWSRWVELTEWNCNFGGCYDSKITFKTIEAAREFAEKYICGDAPYNTRIIKEVETNTCQ